MPAEDPPHDDADDADGDPSASRRADAQTERRADAPDEQSLADEEHAPMADLADEVSRRREASAADTLFEEAFTEVDVDEVDEDALWETLESEADESDDEERLGPVVEEVAGVGERVETESDRDVRVVPNRICHHCRFFGDPPDLHCTHDGTEIREVVDVDHFEVVDCPVVANTDEFGGAE